MCCTTNTYKRLHLFFLHHSQDSGECLAEFSVGFAPSNRYSVTISRSKNLRTCIILIRALMFYLCRTSHKRSAKSESLRDLNNKSPNVSISSLPERKTKKYGTSINY